jgi:hypothetical protein
MQHLGKASFSFLQLAFPVGICISPSIQLDLQVPVHSPRLSAALFDLSTKINTITARTIIDIIAITNVEKVTSPLFILFNSQN